MARYSLGESSKSLMMPDTNTGSKLGATAMPPPLHLDNLNISSSSHASSHRKQSSISSVSSNSSKTAAFFASSPEQPMPYSLSRQGSTSSTSGAQGRYSSMNFDNFSTMSPPGSLERGSSLERGGSISSVGSARRWRDFEGRPVTPLPSPCGRDRPEQLDFPFPGPSRKWSTDSNCLSPTEPSRSEDKVSHLSGTQPGWLSTASLSTAAQTQVPIEAASLSPGQLHKTADFFWSTGSSMPRIGLDAEENASLEGVYEQQKRNLQQRRHPSGSTHLTTPDRLPSLVSQPPSPGLSQWSASTATPGRENESLNVAAQPGNGEQGRTYILLGSQPIHPSAYVSPPSPDPQDEKGTPSSEGQSIFPAHMAKATRHVHGPSSNATGISVTPPVHMMDGDDKRQKATDSTDSMMSRVKADVSKSGSRLMPQTEEREDEATGLIGSYRIDRVLGVGAFSKVVLARRLPRRQATATPQDPFGSTSQREVADKVPPLSGNVMALKMLEREPCKHNERMRVSWVREVEVLKHIVHPNIVRFSSSFSTQKHHVLVLESVAGGELFDYLAKDQMEIARREWLVRRIFGELANAIGWMHSINLVHRDIKLENILLTVDLSAMRPLTPALLPSGPLVKISDFGLSRFIDAQAPLLETRCGSEEYAAPELVMGKRYEGRKTDVWALGVVLYALLSGSLPFLPPDTSKGSDDSYSSAEMAQGAHVTRETPSQSISNTMQFQPQGRVPDARARKAHLLRIAKGDLRWPKDINDDCRDEVSAPSCSHAHRLITPPARLLVAKLLRRDPEKRIDAWDVWQEQWLNQGSIRPEKSAAGIDFVPPPNPRSEEGKAWLNANARVHSGASDVVLDD